MHTPTFEDSTRVHEMWAVWGNKATSSLEYPPGFGPRDKDGLGGCESRSCKLSLDATHESILDKNDERLGFKMLEAIRKRKKDKKHSKPKKQQQRLF